MAEEKNNTVATEATEDTTGEDYLPVPDNDGTEKPATEPASDATEEPTDEETRPE
jgi:hypothetical protein